MDILHGAIKNRFDGNIEAYWSRYKDALLADSELKTLISVEMDWLRDNQPDAYKLLCRMGCYRYQDVKTVPFEGLICLLWDVPESRQSWVVDCLGKTSLIEIKGEYYLHPAVRESAKSRLLENKIDWETGNLVISDFYFSIAGEVKSPEDGYLLIESFCHAIESNNFQKAVQLLMPERDIEFDIKSTPIISKLRSFGYMNESISCLEMLSKNIDKIENHSIIGHIYGHLAVIYTSLGMFDKAITTYKTSFSISEKFEDKYLRLDFCADFKGGLGLLYIHMADYIQAEEMFCEAFKYITELGNDGNKYLCYKYACLSFLYCQYEDRDIAEQQINKSIEFLSYLENSSHTWIRCYTLYYLSRSLIFYQNYSESQNILNKLQMFAEKNSFRLAENLVTLAKGYLFISQSNYLAGIGECLCAVKGFKRIGAKYELADTYFQLGLTYQAMGDNDQTEEYKAKALELFEQMEAPKQIERVNKAFGDNIQ